MRKHLASIGIAAALVVTAAIASFAQSEAPKSSGGPALDGFCPVAYVEMKQAVKGDPKHASVHQGQTYHFANAQAKQMFDNAPAKYVPAYDGICATGVAMGMKLKSDPKLFVVHDGKAYLFSDAKAKGMFEKDTAGIIAKADANWPRVKQQK